LEGIDGGSGRLVGDGGKHRIGLEKEERNGRF